MLFGYKYNFMTNCTFRIRIRNIFKISDLCCLKVIVYHKHLNLKYLISKPCITSPY